MPFFAQGVLGGDIDGFLRASLMSRLKGAPAKVEDIESVDALPTGDVARNNPGYVPGCGRAMLSGTNAVQGETP